MTIFDDKREKTRNLELAMDLIKDRFGATACCERLRCSIRLKTANLAAAQDFIAALAERMPAHVTRQPYILGD